MQINLTGHGVHVTPALRAFTEEKFGKLSKYFDRITSIHVIFDVDKDRQIAEATILVRKAEMYAKAESADMYSTIDSLVDKLHRQLVKHKEKLQECRAA